MYGGQIRAAFVVTIDVAQLDRCRLLAHVAIVETLTAGDSGMIHARDSTGA